MQPCIAIVLALLSLCHAATGALEGYIDRDAAVGTIVRSRQYIDAGPLYLRREVNDAPLIVTSNDLEAERLFGVYSKNRLVLKSKLPDRQPIKNRYDFNVTIHESYFAYLPVTVAPSYRVVASVTIYVVWNVGTETKTSQSPTKTSRAYTKTTLNYVTEQPAVAFYGYVNRSASIGTRVRSLSGPYASPLLFQPTVGEQPFSYPLKITSADPEVDRLFKVVEPYLVLKSELPALATKKTYSLTISLNSSLMGYVVKYYNVTFASTLVVISIIDDAPATPASTIEKLATELTSTPLTPSNTGTDNLQPIDPTKTLVLLRSTTDSVRLDWMSVLLRIVLLILLLALLWKVLCCIFRRPTSNRSLTKSSYTINLL